MERFPNWSQNNNVIGLSFFQIQVDDKNKTIERSHLLAVPQRVDDLDLIICDSVFHFGKVFFSVLDLDLLCQLLVEVVDDVIAGVFRDLGGLFDGLKFKETKTEIIITRIQASSMLAGIIFSWIIMIDQSWWRVSMLIAKVIQIIKVDQLNSRQ